MGGRWSKKQIQEFYKRKTRKARLLGDAKRLKNLKNLLDKTGGGKGSAPFVAKCYRGCLLLQRRRSVTCRIKYRCSAKTSWSIIGCCWSKKVIYEAGPSCQCARRNRIGVMIFWAQMKPATPACHCRFPSAMRMVLVPQQRFNAHQNLHHRFCVEKHGSHYARVN